MASANSFPGLPGRFTTLAQVVTRVGKKQRPATVGGAGHHKNHGAVTAVNKGPKTPNGKK